MFYNSIIYILLSIKRIFTIFYKDSLFLIIQIKHIKLIVKIIILYTTTGYTHYFHRLYTSYTHGVIVSLRLEFY